MRHSANIMPQSDKKCPKMSKKSDFLTNDSAKKRGSPWQSSLFANLLHNNNLMPVGAEWSKTERLGSRHSSP